jgi:glycosyltransferase involved in cell wall biosynthesis
MDLEKFKGKYEVKQVKENLNHVNQNPLVSVCVQTYKHVNYIKQCLDGILFQKTNFEFEILLGEDDSNDGTRELCVDYAKRYPDKIRLFLHHRENNIKIGGQPTGRFNFLYNLHSSKGEYIALCEGDDYWTDPLKLQKQLDFLEGNEEYSFCFTRFQTKDERTNTFLDDENSKHFDKNQSFIDYDFERFYKGWHIGTQTVMFINTPETKNFYKQYQLPRDMHLYVELLKQGKGACLKDFCAVYRLTGKGVYTSTSKFQQIIKGAKVYEDIYKSNKDIIFIELKYRKFFKSYLRMLASNKNILGYVVQMFKSFKITKKVNYLKEDSIFLFKKFYSKL